MDLKINFHKADEIERIKYTIAKLDWFIKQGYEINLPDKIKEVIHQGRIPTDEEILKIISIEFNHEEYKEKSQDLFQRWKEAKDDFLKKIATLGLSLQSTYLVSFTKYGVGGSYRLPNNIQINFDYANTRNTLGITFHEIIHLTIEYLIREYNIDHWTKERLVDLIYAKFFPKERLLQKDLEKLEQIKEIFNRFFPDIKKVIIGVSKL